MNVTSYMDLLVGDDQGEKQVVADVLQGRAYPPPQLRESVKIRTVADIGAHVGAAACFFHYLWRDARIVCYEPAPDCHSLLQRNAPFAELRPYALSDFSGKANLRFNVSPAHRTLCCEDGQEVRVVDAREELAALSPDVIKLDCEGMELPIMQRCLEDFVEASVVYVEFHRWDDRLVIEELMTRSHVLFSASITYSLNRGELGYVNKTDVRPAALRALRLPA